ncbi:MAG: ABC transporter ATP-binding protein [Alphaproteobacteria bacterium]|nr:MAG: ABC transporter ATP-binding protein [Alphaproteobacteria bacterium]
MSVPPALPASVRSLPDVPPRAAAGAELAGGVLALSSLSRHGGGVMSVMTSAAPPLASEAARPLVEVKNLGRVFDVSKPWLNRLTEGLPRRLLTAAAEVTFSINKRETFALVGESGSGKSTVAKMVVGLIAPTTGEVIIDGVSMSDRRHDADRRRLRRRIQMVFQDPYASLNPRWRALDIVAEPLRAFGIAQSEAETAKQVGELLRLVGLDPADGTKYPHEFSGGQRQRIAIARALACNPEFIVCDEPTSALDVSVQAQILNLMRDLQDRFGLTYLFISHNLAVVRHMANRIGVMYLGRLVEVAPAREMFAKPKHPYTRMLLDAVPDLDLTGRKRKPVEGEVPNPVDPPPGCPFHPRCPFANERCRVEMPQPILTGGATVRCHAVEEGRI